MTSQWELLMIRKCFFCTDFYYAFRCEWNEISQFKWLLIAYRRKWNSRKKFEFYSWTIDNYAHFVQTKHIVCTFYALLMQWISLAFGAAPVFILKLWQIAIARFYGNSAGFIDLWEIVENQNWNDWRESWIKKYLNITVKTSTAYHLHFHHLFVKN